MNTISKETREMIAEELRRYFALNGTKNTYLMEVTGLSSGSISNVLKGKQGMSAEVSSKLAARFGFDLQFLLTGQGSLFPPRIAQPRTINAPVTGNVTQGDNSPINLAADIAALQAENERLRNEVEFLRELAKKS